jgi:hypothetical protein
MGQIVTFELKRRELFPSQWIPVSKNASKKPKQEPASETENLGVIQSELKWILRIGWAAISAAAIFAGGLLTWYLPKELSANSAQLRSDLGERIARLEDKIDSLNLRLQQSQSPLGRIIVGPNEAKALSSSELRQTFEKANKFIDASLKEERPAATPDLTYEVSSVRAVLHLVTMSKDAREAGVSTLGRLAAYDTLGRLVRTGKLQNIFIQDKFANSGTAISAPLENAKLTIFVDSDFVNVGQDLTGFKWVRDRFRNSRILYSGGPLYLSEVSFTDCSFQFAADPVSRKVLDLIRVSNGKTVSIVVDPDFTSLDEGPSLR